MYEADVQSMEFGDVRHGSDTNKDSRLRRPPRSVSSLPQSK